MAGGLLGLLGAVLATHSMARVYESDMTFYLANSSGAPVSTLLAQNAQDRVATYITLASSSPVVKEVLGEAGTQGVGNFSVEGSGIANTIFMTLAVRTNNAAATYRVAQSYATVFPNYISNFEKSRSETDGTTLRVLQPPSAVGGPISPNPHRNDIIGVALGFVVGLAGLLLMESTDTRLRNQEDVERVSGLPVLASVPLQHRSDPLVAATQPRSQRAEAIRQVRTNVQFAAIDNPLNSLVVTSALAGEGKTSIASNLAITCARAGQRVVLVDADLRRPMVGEFMGLEDSVGLTSVLIGDAALDDALVAWGDGALCVLPSGPLPANPSELLGSQRMVNLVEELERRFDLVVLDSPPLLPVTDAAVLASTAADGVLMVTRVGLTRRHRLKGAVQSLGKLQLRVVGIVANWTDAIDDYHYYASSPSRRSRFRGRRRKGSEERARSGEGIRPATHRHRGDGAVSPAPAVSSPQEPASDREQPAVAFGPELGADPLFGDRVPIAHATESDALAGDSNGSRHATGLGGGFSRAEGRTELWSDRRAWDI